MSGGARDPSRALRRDPNQILVWNGLVTRMRRSVAEKRDGELASTTFAGRPGRAFEGSGTNPDLVPEPTPLDPDLP